MLTIPDNILTSFGAILNKRAVNLSNAENESLSPMSPAATASPRPVPRQRWRVWEEGYAVKSDSPEWDTAIAELASEIKMRHYSRKTLTPIPDKQELRRYHLHETHVQESLYEAGQRAKLTKGNENL